MQHEAAVPLTAAVACFEDANSENAVSNTPTFSPTEETKFDSDTLNQIFTLVTLKNGGDVKDKLVTKYTLCEGRNVQPVVPYSPYL